MSEANRFSWRMNVRFGCAKEDKNTQNIHNFHSLHLLREYHLSWQRERTAKKEEEEQRRRIIVRPVGRGQSLGGRLGVLMCGIDVP